MARRHPSLPDVWLISDARNDAALERVLHCLPRGSGFIFRHYHLDPHARRTRFEVLKRIAGARGHLVVLAGSAREARRWGADGNYGAPGYRSSPSGGGGSRRLTEGARQDANVTDARAPSTTASRRSPSPGGGGSRAPLRLATAHSLREIGRCRNADAILLSPVFPTCSHPGARTLGPLRFRFLAARSLVPVIALGGMDARRARRLGHRKWAAIDGLCDKMHRSP